VLRKVIGPAWQGIFRADGDKIAQYPRRDAPEDENFWHIVYFIMYGCLGTLAQDGGIMITKRSITREALVLYARIYGTFHIIIGIHHLIWSWNLSHGKL
jgi:DMSO/TMAO reductase YedYZ heme-binding membrane subunit